MPNMGGMTVKKSASNQKVVGKIQHWQIVSFILLIFDVFAANFSYFMALWIRFDLRFSSIPKFFLRAYVEFMPIYSLMVMLIFYAFKMYKSIWRFASYIELIRVFFANALTGVLHIVFITLYRRMPITYYTFGMVIQFFLTIGVRFSYRLVLLERGRRAKMTGDEKIGRVMLIGAGSAGRMILRDINSDKSTNDRVVCIIDDNRNKWNRYIDDVIVIGGRESIIENAEKFNVDKIYLAIPSASPKVKRDILNICKETSCELKNLPSVYLNFNDAVKASNLQKVEIEDLLGRDPIKVDLDEIFAYLKGKTILVTGGGGSIGSELCRQVAAHQPKQLIIFDIYENNAHDIQLELMDSYPELNLEVLIGSVRDSKRVDDIFDKYKPEVVYHAAAHKHVPLMEDSPNESIKNNVFGTYNTAYAAMVHGCKRFLLISTDKAVNPTNIMGASKRLCEMVIQSFDKSMKTGSLQNIPLIHLGIEEGEIPAVRYSGLRSASTEFVAVRFGNVLGSNGSVIPRFKKQIENGGPITVTHPDIIRYFMTIPEAVSLVLQAGTYAKGGEIFVLDMGEPIKIDTLARNLIRLSGLKEGVDIKIEYTGLRPGEKLYEEKLMAEEGLQKTDNNLIHIGKPLPFDEKLFFSQLVELLKLSYQNSEDVCAQVAGIVPTYKYGA